MQYIHAASGRNNYGSKHLSISSSASSRIRHNEFRNKTFV